MSPSLSYNEAVIDALERAFYAFPREYAKTDGAELHEERDCWWCISPIDFPPFNCIFDLRFTEESVKTRIAELREVFHRAGRAFMVASLPRCTPSNLAQQLTELAPVAEVTLNAMACSIEELSAPPQLPANIEIITANTVEQVEHYARLYPLLFGAPTEGWIDALVRAEIEIFHSGHDPFHRYLALLDGQPIAAGMTAMDAGDAVLDTLLTLPEHRNKGIGHALLHRALLDERERGATTALVWAGPGADKLYARVGFKYVSQARLFIFA